MDINKLKILFTENEIQNKIKELAQEMGCRNWNQRKNKGCK